MVLKSEAKVDLREAPLPWVKRRLAVSKLLARRGAGCP